MPKLASRRTRLITPCYTDYLKDKNINSLEGILKSYFTYLNWKQAELGVSYNPTYNGSTCCLQIKHVRLHKELRMILQLAIHEVLKSDEYTGAFYILQETPVISSVTVIYKVESNGLVPVFMYKLQGGTYKDSFEHRSVPLYVKISKLATKCQLPCQGVSSLANFLKMTDEQCKMFITPSIDGLNIKSHREDYISNRLAIYAQYCTKNGFPTCLCRAGKNDKDAYLLTLNKDMSTSVIKIDMKTGRGI